MIKRFYEKNELGFAIAWIVAYVVVMGTLRGTYGDEGLATLLAMIAFTLASLVFLSSTSTWQKYGLTSWPNGRRFLYYVPFVLLCTTNLWLGISPHYGGLAQVWALTSLALVGWVEEFVFRGLLFRAMEKENVAQAIVVSAVTFGAGHIVNLLTGHANVETFLQIAYATAIGFAFVMVVYKGGSLWPCVLTHSFVNATSTLSNQSIPQHLEALLTFGPAVFIVIVAGGYAWYLYKRA